MQRHLFLTGAESAVCAQMLREALGARMMEAGGFVTLREESGLSLIPAAGAAGADGFEPLRFLTCGAAGEHTDNEVFRSEGARLLREAPYYPFAVLDFTGGFDLLIPQYRDALAELLNAELPLLAVLLSPREAEQLRRSLGLGEKYTLYGEQIRRALKADPDSLLLDCSGLARLRARRVLDSWVQEYAH